MVFLSLPKQRVVRVSAEMGLKALFLAGFRE